MTTLFRKDVRLLRPVFIATAAMLFVSYVAPAAFAVASWLYLTPKAHSQYLNEWIDADDLLAPMLGRAVYRGAGFAWVWVMLMIAAVGGAAFALERRERWGEFAAMLPVSRGRAILTKAVATVVACGAVALVNQTVFLAGDAARSTWAPTFEFAPWPWTRWAAWPVLFVGGVWLLRRRRWLVRLGVSAAVTGGLFVIAEFFTGSYFVATLNPRVSVFHVFERLSSGWTTDSPLPALSVVLLGLSWLLSALTRSPTIATSATLGLVVGGWFLSWQCLESASPYLRASVSLITVVDAVAIGVGLLAFAAGVVVQIRRGSP